MVVERYEKTTPLRVRIASGFQANKYKLYPRSIWPPTMITGIREKERNGIISQRRTAT